MEWYIPGLFNAGTAASFPICHALLCGQCALSGVN